VLILDSSNAIDTNYPITLLAELFAEPGSLTAFAFFTEIETVNLEGDWEKVCNPYFSVSEFFPPTADESSPDGTLRVRNLVKLVKVRQEPLDFRVLQDAANDSRP
jgi:hypothetical protein